MDIERGEARALERSADARRADAVRVRDERVVRVREELAVVLRGLNIRDEERAARVQVGREGARDVVDRGEVVVRRAALRDGRQAQWG